MLSIDTNILFLAFYKNAESHQAAYNWISSIQGRQDVAISEFVLVELYGLLRNPSVVKPKPLRPDEAVRVINIWRQHPKWRTIGFPTNNSRELHDELWQKVSEKSFAFRRIYDVRTALSMVDQGVTEFATANTKDFQGVGFSKVWNPLEHFDS